MSALQDRHGAREASFQLQGRNASRVHRDRARARAPGVPLWLGAMVEEGRIIGCKLDGQSVTLEPGGQFELSGAPLSNLHQTCDEVNSHLYQAKAISEEVGVGFLGVGFDPKWRTEDVPIMPKERYNIMRNYMPKVGTLGLDMMLRSCTIQVRSLRNCALLLRTCLSRARCCFI